ncbi:MAG TPA: acyltransferase [Caulobacteraceae bacterium]|jgi:peptidoglycan/LPS O-acetylase OafA/YrhL|nr:acyltransferase [Caulobacteraceae bacterium]
MIRRLGFLNGFRAGAALWVLIAHCLIWSGYTGFLPQPKLAVAVFMLLSGYLMAFNAAARETAEPLAKPSTWLTFYARRFFRLAPLYYVALLADVLLLPMMKQGYGALWSHYALQLHADPNHEPSKVAIGAGSFVAHAGFVFGLFPKLVSSTLLPDWSLSLEAQFYAVFPFLYLAIRRWGSAAALVVAAVCAASLPFRELYPDPGPLPMQIDYFLAGILVYEAAQRRARFAFPLALLLSVSEIWLYRTPTIVLPAAVMVMYLLSRGATRWGLAFVEKLLDTAIARGLADISYGLYLVHGFFVAAAGVLFSQAAWFTQLGLAGRVGVMIAFVLPCSIVASVALHWLVERPGIELGRRLLRRRAPLAEPLAQLP